MFSLDNELSEVVKAGLDGCQRSYQSAVIQFTPNCEILIHKCKGNDLNDFLISISFLRNLHSEVAILAKQKPPKLRGGLAHI